MSHRSPVPQAAELQPEEVPPALGTCGAGGSAVPHHSILLCTHSGCRPGGPGPLLHTVPVCCLLTRRHRHPSRQTRAGLQFWLLLQTAALALLCWDDCLGAPLKSRVQAVSASLCLIKQGPGDPDLNQGGIW